MFDELPDFSSYLDHFYLILTLARFFILGLAVYKVGKVWEEEVEIMEWTWLKEWFLYFFYALKWAENAGNALIEVAPGPP